MQTSFVVYTFALGQGFFQQYDPNVIIYNFDRQQYTWGLKIFFIYNGATIVSKSTHNLVSCKCNNCYIDGGKDYLHFGGNDFNKILIIFDDGTEILASDEEEYKNKYEELENNRLKELSKNESFND